MVRLADYVMDFLADCGIRDIFTVSGGGSMYLLDALGKHPDIRYVCNHHEQASAMAAEAYARVTRNFGVCLVSTGPATTNTMTGVACAWNDSIPVMFISGQANSKNLVGDTGQRQRGVHEADIVSMVSPITKYAFLVKDASRIREYLERAYFFMMEGRKGPVWLDIPLDIQNTMIDPATLVKADLLPHNDILRHHPYRQFDILWDEAESPVVVVGAGALSEIDSVLYWITKHHIPFVTTKNAYGYIPYDTEGYMGMMGINGNRKANKIIQNADTLLILGARMPFPAIGYNVSAFAPKAKKVLVEIDTNQANNTFITPDLIFYESVKNFMTYMNILPSKVFEKSIYNDYLYIEDLPNLQPNKDYVNSYYFYKELSKYIPPEATLVTDQGAAFYSWSQAYKVKRGGLSFTNGGFSPMGYGLPAAIGAYVAKEGVVACVVGDGGFEMNIQELQTIAHYDLPIKIFVFENKGYGSIKGTQDSFFKGDYVGSDPESGVSCVDIEAIAKAYEIDSLVIHNDTELDRLEIPFIADKPMIIKVILDPHQEIVPKVKAEYHADGTITPGQFDRMYPYDL